MRVFLFKILFRLTWWIAPDRPKVNKFFDMYQKELNREKQFAECQERQAEMDKCVRPRTYSKTKGTIRHSDYFDDDNWKAS